MVEHSPKILASEEKATTSNNDNDNNSDNNNDNNNNSKQKLKTKILWFDDVWKMARRWIEVRFWP